MGQKQKTLLSHALNTSKRREKQPREISRNTQNLKSNFLVFLLISRRLTLLSPSLFLRNGSKHLNADFLIQLNSSFSEKCRRPHKGRQAPLYSVNELSADFSFPDLKIRCSSVLFVTHNLKVFQYP